ncbi:AsmA family protein [Leptospira congkakensis]|uniref:AsmA family protein n=1 Tax=Leptospira congkakensis TaxID=2484932 RepID=A0A4Z0ZYQ0_9LEPT|nr:AsmA family protein [Leptospira congkakensis]TGL86292.1 AsmA family protein [Leptospira congkakensis]TGL94163.1 AsmA family protein [Leptospira congkakensis]TGL94429.1 AsmA family protein [Leptospira congkakensis]
MKLSIRDKIKGVVGKILLTGIFVLSMTMFFILYPLLADPDYYKKLILDTTYQLTGLQVNYQTSEPVFFPFPGIELADVSVAKNDDELIKVHKLRIEVYYGVFVGQALEIRKIYLNTGTVELVREKDESFPLFERILSKSETNLQETQTKTEESANTNSKTYFSKTFANFVNQIEIKNVTILFEDKLYARNIKLYLWETTFQLDQDLRNLDIYIYGKLNEETISFSTNIFFVTDEMSYESARLEGEFTFQNIKGIDLHDILIIFTYGDLRFARASGAIPFYKRDETKIYAIADRVHIRDLALKDGKPFADGYASTIMNYDILESKLSFADIVVDWKGKSKLNGSGFVNFLKPPLSPTISFEGTSDYLDVPSLIKVIKIWVDPDLEKSILTRNIPSTGYVNRMNVYLNFNLRNLNAGDFHADSLKLNLHYAKRKLNITKYELRAYEGNAIGTGHYLWGKNAGLEIKGNIKNLAVAPILSDLFNISPITGKLDSEFLLSSPADTEDGLIKNLQITGNINAKNGELLSYTNILKPISSIGSVINLKKIDFSRATPYNELKFDFQYSKETIEVKNFALKADGIVGSGGGKIGFNKNIDMRFTIAMPGVAGKALKLPIIYRGTYGVSAPFIDPIWLGSVYVGTIFLASPAGAAVGGIAGSAMSEYVNKAVDNVTGGVQRGWKGIKSLFGGKEEEEPEK